MKNDPFIAAEVEQRKQIKCVLCKQLLTLDIEKREQARDAILGVTRHEDKPITLRTIRRVLESWGVTTNETTIRSHRVGDVPMELGHE